MEFTPEELWVAVGFVAFVALLIYKKVPAMVTASLDKRSAEIKAKLDEAQQLRDEAKELLASYEKKLREAQTEAAEYRRPGRNRREGHGQGSPGRDGSVAGPARSKLAEDKIAQAGSDRSARSSPRGRRRGRRSRREG